MTKDLTEIRLQQKNGWVAHSSKPAPCAYSTKLATKPFHYREMSQTFQGIMHLSILVKE